MAGWMLIGVPPAMTAQVRMRDVVRTMPDSLFPYLTANNRLDCIDFKDAGMKAEVRNSLDGNTVMQTLTDDFASLRLNEALTAEMRLLDHQGRQTLCLVTTFGTDLRESVISFYTPDWQPLDAADFITLPDGMFVVEWGGQEPELILTPVMELERPAMEDQQEIIKPSINLKWTGGSFKQS